MALLTKQLRTLVEAAGAAVDSIKLNGISSGRHRGRPFRVKSRRRGSEHIAGLANLFFPLANAHIQVWADPKKWQRWEIHCYHLLNGDKFRAFTAGPRTICAETLPGENLRDLAKSGNLTKPAIKAAAQEICRAHLLYSKYFRGGWSHGDMHMGNVIYDKKTDRARLIDFEIVHDKKMSAVARHADDLLVFLQELVAFVPAKKWLPFALCFLDTYNRPRVVAKLRRLLVIPTGVAGLWWKIRTCYVDGAKMKRRLSALCRVLDERNARTGRKR